jgi:hypothetical protein
MSAKNHPNSSIDSFILSKISKSAGIEDIKCESKESIVFDEKETTCMYSFKKPSSEVSVTLTVSEPLYYCGVSFAKSDKVHFPFGGYLKSIIKSDEIEQLFESFIDEKITAEEYTLNYLTIFNKYLSTTEVQNIMAGEYWPNVPLEEDPASDDDDF